jgi:hypothetical protein
MTIDWHKGWLWSKAFVTSTSAAIVAIVVVGYAVTLRVFYPGVMTWDAWYVHNDIATGFRGDWQSPIMTELWALIDPIAPGAASMFLLITMLYWLAFAVLALAVARKSSGTALALAATAFMPPAFILVGMIWRDVLFAALWLLAAAMVFAVAERRDAWRTVAQVVAFGLLILGLLLRMNALFAAPILATYVIWPTRFDLKSSALLYVPAVIVFYALIPFVYYGLLGAKHQNALHSILVFDLGGITHFTKHNQFPVTWTPEEDKLLTDSCYRPEAWDYYWTRPPCIFVMERLEADQIFGSPALVDAWRRAVAAYPISYLEHRFTVMGQFLFGENDAMWTIDIAHPDQTVFADNPWFVAIKDVNDVLMPTPLFRAGTWLLLCVVACTAAFRRRNSAAGAFAIAVAGSAVVYMVTFLPFGVATDFRYAYWAALAGLTSAVLLGMPGASAKPEPP